MTEETSRVYFVIKSLPVSKFSKNRVYYYFSNKKHVKSEATHTDCLGGQSGSGSWYMLKLGT